MPPGNDLTGTDLGGRTLTPGAYGFSSSAQLTGQLTLDAQGDPNAQFVFVIGTTLTTATASSVILTNGASPCNVYWKVGSSATLGTSTSFEGNLMALATVSLNDSVTVLGRVLAREGEVTLINDVLSAPQCATASTPPPANRAGGGNGTPASDRHRLPPAARRASDTARGAGQGPGRASRGGKRDPRPRQEERRGRPRQRPRSPRRPGHASPTTGSRSAVHGSHQVRVPATPGVHVVTAQRHLHRLDPAEDDDLPLPRADPGAPSPPRSLALHRMTCPGPEPCPAASAAGSWPAW